MDKETLRKEALNKRDLMKEDDRIAFSQSLENYCDALPKSKIVAGFWPIRSEVDPRPLMFSLREKGASLALPAITENKTMVFRAFQPGDQLIEMGFGTLGPSKDAQCVDPDLLLMPLAAFDKVGNRIGYGAGYYDRAIAHLHEKGAKPTLVGLAFECQKVEQITPEPHDIPLQAIITENGLHFFNS